MRRSVLALGLVLGAACNSGAPSVPAPAAPVALRAADWCGAVKASLGAELARFECLSVPNFLVTGFFGKKDNPEQSDFVNGCLAGQGEHARRLGISARPAGELVFSLTTERAVDASGGLDLGFLGPWAPRLSLGRRAGEKLTVSVMLRDAEIRVLSSVAEIIGQEYEATGEDPKLRDALERCIAGLCGGDALVYTSKVLAAVPVIRVAFSSSRATSGAAALAAGAAGFEVVTSSRAEGTLELRAKMKLNVAALVEETRPAFERAGTCGLVSTAQTRRRSVASLRELGVQLLAGRELGSIPAAVERVRQGVKSDERAFSEAERLDLLATLEAVEGASRELGREQPTARVCELRELLERMLGRASAGHLLHAELAELAEPVSKRLTALANQHALSCAEPVWYLDADHDGYGDPAKLTRASHQPDGHVGNALDCYDRNPDARPGQIHYFAAHRGDGSFDYDCDGAATRRAELVSRGCQELTTFGYPTECWSDSGWQGMVPGCGRPGRWLARCAVSLLTCAPAVEEQRVQLCH
ncbi:MAG: hypothetical protein OZ921_06460 [Sorangiineae bacterium]|nr:hypothetical protein [Polyangiaceae bacterium]MEB2322136.1 hypothetical protein [Sorangiineae bacterium]